MIIYGKVSMKRSIGFLIIFIIYLLAFLIAYYTYKLLKVDSFIIKIIICDIVATIYIWVCGIIYHNASVYDPYWSVAPMVIIPLFIKELHIGSIILLIVVLIWGIRLTLNWVYTFKGLQYQDWRYSQFQKKYPRIFQLINLTGIHLMPTIIVISVMLPAFVYLSNPKFNIVTIIGAIISFIGIIFELFADVQMHSFRKMNSKNSINIGLWKYSRHPNYLGEILMWWGIFILSLSGGIKLIYIIGPILNTLMFNFISIPLMEKRLTKSKEDYSLYQAKTSRLLLLPPRKG